MFYNALDALATEKNYLPDQIVSLFETYSILALIFSIAFTSVANLRINKLENRRPSVKTSPVKNLRRFGPR